MSYLLCHVPWLIFSLESAPLTWASGPCHQHTCVPSLYKRETKSTQGVAGDVAGLVEHIYKARGGIRNEKLFSYLYLERVFKELLNLSKCFQCFSAGTESKKNGTDEIVLIALMPSLQCWSPIMGRSLTNTTGEWKRQEQTGIHYLIVFIYTLGSFSLKNPTFSLPLWWNQ